MIDETGNGQQQTGVSGGGVIGAIIGAGAGLYDSYQNRKAAQENTDKTIAAQKAEAELAYQRSIAQMQAMNLYNSPQAQMQRFMDAGLNPHLIYGQGNAGNQSGMPSYQPANLQYRYQALSYGSAIQSILPTLMAVGTWMQNMRASEVQIQKGTTDTERTRQLIDFLISRNPQLLKEGENRLSLFPYQRNMIDYQSNQARTKLFEMEQEFRHKFGEGLFTQMGSAWEPDGRFSNIGGIRRLQFLQEASKTKLLEAKSSWSDLNITDPQAIMQMVLGGVMGLAGQTLRLSTHRSRSKGKQPSRSRNYTDEGYTDDGHRTNSYFRRRVYDE